MKSYVLITGASGGLGKAFAGECASRGWDLFLSDVSQEKLEALAKGLMRLYGVDVLYNACDLTDSASRTSFWRQVQRYGVRFHMLINVAGVDFEGLFEERNASELSTIIRLNIEGTVEMTRRVLQYRNPARELRIINVSSLAAFYPMPVKAVYAASKRFLLDFSRAIRQELRSNQVTVTVLCPAGMPTTNASIEGINAQGFMGRITTANVGDVAALTINRALAGRAVYVPGFLNQMMRFFGSLVPANVLAALIGRRWISARQQNSEVVVMPSSIHLSFNEY